MDKELFLDRPGMAEERMADLFETAHRLRRMGPRR